MDNENRIVKKNNSIVSSRMKNFSLIQVKIFNLAISELTPESKEGDILKFQSIDVLRAIGLGEKNHEELRKATLDMIRGVEIKNPNGGISQVPIFTEIEYLPGGIIKIEFHKKVIPLIIQAKKEYTKYYFENIQRLKSMYSIRIYELCKQYQNTNNGYREFEIEDLKFYLDISDKLYPRYFDFKKRVLTSSILEINEKTDLTLELEEFKRNRAVYKIRFYITPKYKDNIEKDEFIQTSISGVTEELTPAGIKLVKEYLISPKIASELQILATSDDYLFYAIDKFSKKLDHQIKQGNKPNNIPKYAEISLREMIPTILISGVVEKEIEEKEKIKIKTKEKELKNKEMKIAKKKKDDFTNNFKEFCNNPSLKEILEESNISSLLKTVLPEELKSVEETAKKECKTIFECSIEELKIDDIYNVLRGNVKNKNGVLFTFTKFVNLRNYFKFAFQDLFMND